MHPSSRSAAFLLLGALPALAASFYVLALSQQPLALWLMQGAAALLMLALAVLTSRLPAMPGPWPVCALALMALLLLALPLAIGTPQGPRRWLGLGPVALYIAPVVLPVLLVLAARLQRAGGLVAGCASALLLSAAGLLAAQPDLAQTAALAGAALVLTLAAPKDRAWAARSALLGLGLGAACAWAAWQPDPLAPVPHVEQVFALAWAQGKGSFAALLVAALVLLVTLWRQLAPQDKALATSLTLYFALLFAASYTERTPVPLMGYGAGPVLGYGLMVGAVLALGRR